MFHAAKLGLHPLYAPLYVYSILSSPAQASRLLVRIAFKGPLRD